jgi:hypothetical protein
MRYGTLAERIAANGTCQSNPSSNTASCTWDSGALPAFAVDSTALFVRAFSVASIAFTPLWCDETARAMATRPLSVVTAKTGWVVIYRDMLNLL